MDINALVRQLREQIVQLRLNRYVFGTHQEIIRRNSALCERPLSFFGEWARTNYVSAASSAIRRLASNSSEDGDVNLILFLEKLIAEPEGLWPHLQRVFPEESTEARKALNAQAGSLLDGWGSGAARRVLGNLRARVIREVEAISKFANKRIAHIASEVEARATFDQLDFAIGIVTKIAEASTRAYMMLKLERVPAGGYEARMLELEIMRNLDAEMKTRLPNKWNRVFLSAWATEEIIALPLGDMKPPKSTDREP